MKIHFIDYGTTEMCTTLLNRKSPYDEGKDLVNLYDFTRIYSIFVFQPFLLVENLYINQIET